MSTKSETVPRRPAPQDPQVVGWRHDQLRAAGFPEALAAEAASDGRFDLHAVIELVERGCEPELALRILAPIDEPRDEPRSGRPQHMGAAPAPRRR